MLLRASGSGLAVTPLTAAVLAAVDDADLGEASAVNDAASRVGAVIAIALVPAADRGDRRQAASPHALTTGYRAGDDRHRRPHAAAAVVSWLFVSDERRQTSVA